jgi:hypothetical protein
MSVNHQNWSKIGLPSGCNAHAVRDFEEIATDTTVFVHQEEIGQYQEDYFCHEEQAEAGCATELILQKRQGAQNELTGWDKILVCMIQRILQKQLG